MENSKQKFFTSKNIATLGVLTAVVLILQLSIGSIRIGVCEFSVVLIPIVLGAVILGEIGGAFLGFVFGLVVFIQGVMGISFFTNILFQTQPFLTALICIAKGLFAGYLPALFYKLLSKKNDKVAIIVSSALAPISNTGIFIAMMLIFKNAFAVALIKNGILADSQVYFNFIVFGCAGVNFIVELIINLVASSVILAVIKAVRKK